MSFKLTIGRVAIAGIDLYTNEAIVAIDGFKNVADNRWLYHALPTVASGAVVDVAVKGATLNKRKLQSLTVQLPSITEQRKIAEILDTADESINSAERLIAKIISIKTGLLNQLLNSPEVRFWEHGTVATWGDVTLGRQRSPSSKSGPGMTPYLRVANVFDGRIDFTDVLTMNFSTAERQ